MRDHYEPTRLEEARDEGYEQGHADGVKEGRAEYESELRACLADLLSNGDRAGIHSTTTYREAIADVAECLNLK